jgi:hypothetical protein
MEIMSQENDWFVTSGLESLGMHEVAVQESRSDWQDDARALLAYVSQYVTAAGKRLLPQETMNYGFWLLKFSLGHDSLLEIHEYDAYGVNFVPGAKLSMEFWRDQHRVCQSAGAASDPPRRDQLAAMSPDLLQTSVAEGVRYNLGDPMSGWILTSKGYDGPVNELRREHLWHLATWRRELIRYLALPVGYRFWTDSEASVRFDAGVASAR